MTNTRYSDKKSIRVNENLVIHKYFYASGVRIYINFADQEPIAVWVGYPENRHANARPKDEKYQDWNARYETIPDTKQK